MVFSTIIFLFRFLPITLALYYLAPAKLKNTVLFVCSLVFYCWGEVRFFPVMLALILINYLCGLGLEAFDAKPGVRKVLLLVALAASLGMLFYFKYANFVLRSINSLLGTGFAAIQGISVLPLGISFYTFQTLSYTIDVYRREVKTEHNIIDFGAYVVMFPQLIAGPIVKYRDVSAQLHVYKHRYSLQQIEEGMTLFTFGLAKKVLLADAVGALWTDIIGIADSPSTTFVGLANASTPLVWLGVIAYSLQLYFDFSGYSMMAIGMGKMLGFDFPQNFNFPYISRSITEFCSPASGTVQTGTLSAGACTTLSCWPLKSCFCSNIWKKAGSGPTSTPCSLWWWAGPCLWATRPGWASGCCSASSSSPRAVRLRSTSCATTACCWRSASCAAPRSLRSSGTPCANTP